MSDDPIIRITAPRNDAPAKRPALGRGLGALLGDTRREEPLVTSTPRGESAVSLPAGQGLAMLAVAAIAPHPEQPRRHFDDAALDELAASIAARGVIQPVIVRPLGPGRWQLVASGGGARPSAPSFTKFRRLSATFPSARSWRWR